MSWKVLATVEYRDWHEGLSKADRDRISAVVRLLRESGPSLGRPLVDTVAGSEHANMKELRVGTIRVLFAFNPEREAVLRIGGNKRDRWEAWYREAIPEADRRFSRHLRRPSE